MKAGQLMPMYYFNLTDGDEVADVDGTDLPDGAAAREHAMGVARELMFKSEGMLDHDWSRWTMSVTDDEGREVCSFVLGDPE